MWIVEKYVKYLIGFVLLWGGLYFYRSCGCQKVVGSAMTPTFLSDEFLRVEVGKKRPGDVQVKDLVWFWYQSPTSKETGYLGRVIGLPGDRVTIKDGAVLVNGLPLAEEYMKEEFSKKEDLAEFIVPRDHFFILCDNRREPEPPDSRSFGPIPVSAVWGRVKR